MLAQHPVLVDSSLLHERVRLVVDDEYRGRHCRHVLQGRSWNAETGLFVTAPFLGPALGRLSGRGRCRSSIWNCLFAILALIPALYPCEFLFFLTLGPIAGGFLGETQGWCWVLGLIAITAGVVWISTTLTTHETYAPYIPQSRAKALSKMTGNVYVSRPDAGKPPKTLMQELSVALSRPSVLLFLDRNLNCWKVGA